MFLVDKYNAIASIPLYLLAFLSMVAIWPLGIAGLWALTSILRERIGIFTLTLVLCPLVFVLGIYLFMTFYSPTPMDASGSIQELITTHDRPLLFTLNTVMLIQILFSIWIVKVSLSKLRKRVALVHLALFAVSSFISLKALETHLWDGLS